MKERPINFLFAVVKQLQRRRIAVCEAALIIQTEHHVGGQFHRLPIILIPQTPGPAEQFPAPEIQ